MIEKAGIPTVGISLLKEVTMAVRPPRTLFVDRPLGYPLGLPNDSELQKRIIGSAFCLLTAHLELPVIEDFEESGK